MASAVGGGKFILPSKKAEGRNGWALLARRCVAVASSPPEKEERRWKGVYLDLHGYDHPHLAKAPPGLRSSWPSCSLIFALFVWRLRGRPLAAPLLTRSPPRQHWLRRLFRPATHGIVPALRSTPPCCHLHPDSQRSTGLPKHVEEQVPARIPL